MATIESFIKIGDGFSTPLEKFSEKMSRAGEKLGNLKDNLTRGVKPNLPNGDFDKFDEKISHTSSLFKQLTGAGLAVNGISHAVGGVTAGMSDLVGELNDSSKAWQTFDSNMQMLGMSSQQISKTKDEMQDFAQKTIYSSSDMASTYAQMASVGVKNTDKLVEGFGGLASSATDPTQAMKTLSEQGVQMASKPMIQWQDFRLMLEQAPSGISAVARTMHMSSQQLVQDVQNGKVKTQDFFDAVAKTGTNKQFTKMATSYKTVGQAMDGLKETVANRLQPAFDKFGKVGIDAISGIIDKVGDLNLDKAVDNIMPTFKKLVNEITNGFIDLGKIASKFFDGIGKTGLFDNLVNEFESAKNAVVQTADDLFGTTGQKFSGFEQIGEQFGNAVGGISKSLSAIFDDISHADPNAIKLIAGAFLALKLSLKGFVITGVILLFEWMNKLDPKTVKTLTNAIIAFAVAITVLNVALKKFKGIDLAEKIKGFGGNIKQGIKNKFGFGGGGQEGGGKSPMSNPAEQMGEDVNPSKKLGSASEWLKIGGALVLAGVGVMAIATGFYIMATASTKLASSGGEAIAIFFGMIGAIAVLAVAVAVGGEAMLAGSVGFLIFGVAVLAIGAGIVLASAGLALLATQLPTIANFGLQASINILALGGSLIVFGAGAIVAGAGLIILSAGLIAFSVAGLVATVACFALGAGAMFLGVGLLLVGAGLSLIGVGLSAIASGVMSLYTTFVTIFHGIVTGVSNTMGKIPGLISGFLKNAVNTIKNFNLLDAGKAIINGFINGLKSAWEAGKKFVHGIANWIKEHKGPISYDRRLLIPHGTAVMQGFHEGLKNEFGNVQRSIGDMTASIGNTSVSSPMFESLNTNVGDLLANGFDRAKQSLNGIVEGMKNLDGSNVIDVNGSQTISDMDSSALDNQIGFTSQSKDLSTTNNKSSHINIANGAIQITSTGNADYDGARLTQILEDYLQGKSEGRL